MSYWYASLYVVVEAWDELQLTDPVVDRLLCHPRDYRALLRRYRNSVFHFQKSMLSDKVVNLFAAGTELIFWVRALHDEIVRSFRAHLRGLVYTAEQFEEIRESFEDVVNWFPCEDSPQFDSAAQVFAEGRRLLAANPAKQRLCVSRSSARRRIDSGEVSSVGSYGATRAGGGATSRRPWRPCYLHDFTARPPP
jgi:hypothetical protein